MDEESTSIILGELLHDRSSMDLSESPKSSTEKAGPDCRKHGRCHYSYPCSSQGGKLKFALILQTEERNLTNIPVAGVARTGEGREMGLGTARAVLVSCKPSFCRLLHILRPPWIAVPIASRTCLNITTMMSPAHRQKGRATQGPASVAKYLTGPTR